MSLSLFHARNHPQQIGRRGVVDDVDDRGTPRDLFMFYDRQHHFTVDVAAAAHNAKCERFYDRAANGLEQSWADEAVWCNPPYSDIAPWVRKAWDETSARVVVMLLPANRTEQTWWQQQVEPRRDRDGSPLRCEFLAGRVKFLKSGADRVGVNNRPPFGSCVLTWTPRVTVAQPYSFDAPDVDVLGPWPPRGPSPRGQQ